MAWARIDDGFHDHPKVDGLSLAAVGLWTLCLSHAHRHRRTATVPGHVAEARVKKLAGRQFPGLISELLRAGLWEPAEGGWIIHDFADYLPKQRDHDEAAESGRRGAQKRWLEHGKPIANSYEAASNEVANPMASDSSRASARAFPSRPVPEELTTEGGERTEPSQPANATEHPPSPSDARCTTHRGVSEPGPCNGCRLAREREERSAERFVEKQRREAEARVLACDRCDGVWLLNDDRTPTRRKCDHRRTA